MISKRGDVTRVALSVSRITDDLKLSEMCGAGHGGEPPTWRRFSAIHAGQTQSAPGTTTIAVGAHWGAPNAIAGALGTFAIA